jgi:hypothetical protein
MMMEKQADKMTAGKWPQASQRYKPEEWKLRGRKNRWQKEKKFEACTGSKLPVL